MIELGSKPKTICFVIAGGSPGEKLNFKMKLFLIFIFSVAQPRPESCEELWTEKWTLNMGKGSGVKLVLII